MSTKLDQRIDEITFYLNKINNDPIADEGVSKKTLIKDLNYTVGVVKQLIANEHTMETSIKAQHRALSEALAKKTQEFKAVRAYVCKKDNIIQAYRQVVDMMDSLWLTLPFKAKTEINEQIKVAERHRKEDTGLKF